MCVLLTVASTPTAQADDPTVGELQVRLVESRMHLNDLYARSAAAAERLNGATFELAEAKADLKRQKAEVERAEARLADQRDAVAALTVEQLQSGSGTSRLTTLLESDGPQQLLERAGAYRSTNEALNARVDTLTARQVVRDAAVRRADAAQGALRDAVKDRAAAAAGIDRAIADAEAAADSTRRERDTLIKQLASVQGVTVQEADEEAGRDRRADRPGRTVDASRCSGARPGPGHGPAAERFDAERSEANYRSRRPSRHPSHRRPTRRRPPEARSTEPSPSLGRSWESRTSGAARARAPGTAPASS